MVDLPKGAKVGDYFVAKDSDSGFAVYEIIMMNWKPVSSYVASFSGKDEAQKARDELVSGKRRTDDLRNLSRRPLRTNIEDVFG